jgi:predicted alpha/beta hydrolase family esterase
MGSAPPWYDRRTNPHSVRSIGKRALEQKQQVVVIHGGTSFAKYGDYLRFLKNEELTEGKLKPRKGWKYYLESELGRDFTVLQPRMPNPMNAKYTEWKLWFEKLIPLLHDEVLLVGHSLGGLFLAKYLSTTRFPKKIRALFLLAAPYSKADKTEDPSDFTKLASLSRLSEQVEQIFILHSKDDPLVPVSEARRYKKAIPKAELKLFVDKEHFSQEHFPELVRAIKTATI